MNIQKLNLAISEFSKKRKTNAAYYDENWKERKERKEYYQSFTEEKIHSMTEDEFYEYISKLWSMLIWGNKKYIVDKLIADNGFMMLKNQLADLLYGNANIEKRWNTFMKSVKGMGATTVSELLTYANPKEYVIFNRTTILSYNYLEIPDMPKYNYQYTGEKYVEVCKIANEISIELQKSGAKDYDLLAVDYFLWMRFYDASLRKYMPPATIINAAHKTAMAADFLTTSILSPRQYICYIIFIRSDCYFPKKRLCGKSQLTFATQPLFIFEVV